MPFHIAIDGPVAAGKGTVARLLAGRLGFLYVDAGAMYRTTAYIGKQENVPWEDENGLESALKKHVITLRNVTPEESDGRQITVLLDGADISWEIRTEEMSRGASIVSQFPKVRAELVHQQQELAKSQDVVMEGRDITYKVLPNAQLKIYLDAQAEVRAQRRHQELLSRGKDITYEDVLKDLRDRDARDTGRSADPLKVVDDAWVLDTTQLSIEQVLDTIVVRVEELRAESVNSNT
jgi:cytidylate kinase